MLLSFNNCSISALTAPAVNVIVMDVLYVHGAECLRKRNNLDSLCYFLSITVQFLH